MSAASLTLVMEDCHIGIVNVRLATSASGFTTIESVTYEVLTGSLPYSITNLNSYVVSNEVVETGNNNQTFTFNYSLIRDVAYGLAYADQLDGSATLSFAMPTNGVYTKFWIKVVTPANLVIERGGDRGFPLPNATQGRVTLKAEDLVSKYNLPALTEGDWQFTVAIGNDKFGKPTAAEYAAMANFHVNKAQSFAGKITVDVKHSIIAPAAANLMVAVYDSPDLANAIKVQRASDAAGFTIDGLRENAEYYVAACKPKTQGPPGCEQNYGEGLVTDKIWKSSWGRWD